MNKNKRRLLAGFCILSVLFFVLRIRTIGHILMWDEAWNILSLKAYLLNAVRDPFYLYYKLHPPLYMFFARMLLPFENGFEVRAEYLSLFWNYAAFSVTYLLSARLGGWKYACFAGLFLCCMPLSIGYSTWIKRDAIAITFGVLALYMFVNRNFLFCGLAMGASLLAKETAVFYLLTIFFLIFISKDIKKIKTMSSRNFAKCPKLSSRNFAKRNIRDLYPRIFRINLVAPQILSIPHIRPPNFFRCSFKILLSGFNKLIKVVLRIGRIWYNKP